MFITGLFVEAGAIPGHWIVQSACIWEDAVWGHLEVPRGFLTDFASVPFVARMIPFLDPAGLSRPAALFHDFAYGRGFANWTKTTADLFFRDALLASGCSANVANIFYEAVHEGGQSSWNDDANELKDYFVIPGSYEAWHSAHTDETHSL